MSRSGRGLRPWGMTIKRMDHVGITVTDLAAAVAFFEDLGMELEGKAHMEGAFVDDVIGLEGSRSEIAMMRTPDGQYKVEFSQFETPQSIDGTSNGPIHALGLRHIAFVIDDLDDTLFRLKRHGAEQVGTVEQYEDVLRLVYVRGSEGIIVELCEYFR